MTGKRSWRLVVWLTVGALGPIACASAPPPAPVTAAPRYPNFPVPVVPADLSAPAGVVNQHLSGWRQLQAGDLRGAEQLFGAVLAAVPGFYPSQTAVGFIRLAEGAIDDAARRFQAVTAAHEGYLPAWEGQAEAYLSLGDDAAAMTALERVVALDPTHGTAPGRLELLQFRQVQSLVDSGRRAAAAEAYADARTYFEQALSLSPTSAAILSELAVTEVATGDAALAEQHARQALAAAPDDATAHVALGLSLEAQQRFAEAAEAFERAVALDSRPEWVERRDSLAARARMGSIPPEFSAIPSATGVTRGQAAAYFGVHLASLLARAAPGPPVIATDVRGHWAFPWIQGMTQTGLMSVFPNNTFQPAAPFSRGDLAAIVEKLLALVPQRAVDLARWRAVRPRFTDLPTTNVVYPAAALAVAAGVMSATGDVFAATRPVSGTELEAAVARIQQIAGR